MAKALSPAQQWFRLKSSEICRGHGLVRRGELIWVFDARPSPLGRLYRLQIRLKNHEFPTVTVLTPDLSELSAGRRIPHVYSTAPMRLCLHVPSSDEWRFDKSVADTIVPWAYLWLAYFEHWLATDEWLGGGTHPGEG